MPRFRILVLAVLAACAAAGPGTAIASKPSKPYVEDRPGSGFLKMGGPARDTAEEQFAYAAALEQDGRLKKAAKAYRAYVARWPDHNLAPEAQFRYARVLEDRGKKVKAFHAYQELVDAYPAGFPYEYGAVLDRQYKIAAAVKDHRRGKFLIFPGFKSPDRALEMFEKIVANAPRRRAAWVRGPEAAYVLGTLHEEMGEDELAAAAYLDALVRYPDSPFAEMAAFARCRTMVNLSDATPYDREATLQAYHALGLFNSTFPDSDQQQDAGELTRKMYGRLAESDYEAAKFYDRLAHKPKAALAAYESFVDRFPASEWTPMAKSRIKVLIQVVEEERER